MMKSIIVALGMLTLAIVLSSVVYAQEFTAINSQSSTYIYSPGIPVWNPYTPGNLIGTLGTWMPMALYNPITNEFWPVLARNWSIQLLPNGSGVFTVYLRNDVYWFNGTAVMPFTAWDVYTEFYIGVKVFKYFYPFMQPQYADEDVRVINNYTIQFLFQKWSPTEWIFILTTAISTPYEAWKPIVDKLKTVSAAQALTYANNVTEFVPPYWSLYPYYLTFISTNTMVEKLEPMYFNGIPLLATWVKIFPFNTFSYYPEVDSIFPGGNTQDLALEIAGKSNWGYVGLSSSQIQTVMQHGFENINLYAYSTYGIAINPYNFPTNNMWLNLKFRQALLYVLNRTAITASWGLPGVPNSSWIMPMWHNTPSPDYIFSTFPQSVRSLIVTFNVNWSKAAEILESAGFYEKNGQWYTPSGQPITMTLMAPAQFTNQMTSMSTATVELTEFGIPTKLLGEDVATYPSRILITGDYQAADYFGPGIESYYTGFTSWVNPFDSNLFINTSLAYPFQWPNGTCTPVSLPSLQLPNATLVTCINSTLGWINVSNLELVYYAATPGSKEYEVATEVLFAWWQYFVPQIMWGEKLEPQQVDPHVYDIDWAYKCSNAPSVQMPIGPANLFAQFVIMPPQQIIGLQAGVWMPGPLFFGGITPPGVIPPLAEAMLNGSLWTKYANYASFLGVSPGSFNMACIASYFHTTYTPVTTMTTSTTTTTTTTTTAVTTATTTVTSTVTSTSTLTTTTTAVTTVTVTKPVVSTTLIAGIIVIVIVIAAIIALRRR